MKKYRIAIVENDEDERFFIKEGFDATDLFEIVAMVNNGDALFDWLQENSGSLPDLILSDLNMPGKNGYDIIKGIKEDETYAHIPVFITSTSSTKAFIDKCKALGAADFIIKPDTFIEYSPFVKNLYQIFEKTEVLK